MHRFLDRSTLATLCLIMLGGCAGDRPPAGQQADLAPLQALMEGNLRYSQGHPLHPNQSADRRTELAQGQKPIAIILGCSDSRTPPEIVFDQGLGDLFVVRMAGNVIDDHALGSIEYAAEHLHVSLVIVLGHDKCGALQVALAGGDVPGHAQSIVQALRPPVEIANRESGDRLSNAINANISYIVHQLQTSEPILSHLVHEHKLQIVGARYNFATGKVEILTPVDAKPAR